MSKTKTEQEKKSYSKYRSRKWFLTMFIIIIATLGTFVPPLISAWVLGASEPLVILSGTEWVSIITMIAAAYIGGNVWQKREEFRTTYNPRNNVYSSDNYNYDDDTPHIGRIQKHHQETTIIEPDEEKREA